MDKYEQVKRCSEIESRYIDKLHTLISHFDDSALTKDGFLKVFKSLRDEYENELDQLGQEILKSLRGETNNE